MEMLHEYIVENKENVKSVLKVIHSVGQGHGFVGNVFSLVHLDDLRQNRLSIFFK